MKKLFLPIILILSILIAGCAKNNEVVSPGDDKGGSVILEIDKENAPAGIATVTASLTRQGHNPIVKSMNLLTDSTASLAMENIAVGTWHLKVEAKDEASVVKYMGEKDVVISEGIITQVSLTLLPTATGMGSISIKVTWGNDSVVKKWIDYAGNPVFKGTNQNWDMIGVHTPKILYSNGKYEMWFGNLSQARVGSIGYAYSNDGITWTRQTNQPVITVGPSGAWDCGRTDVGPVIKENGIYYMLYSGWQEVYSPYKVGLATSANGYVWEKNSEPVLSGTQNDAQIVPTSLIKVNNLYYLYYNYRAVGAADCKIGLATSTDLIHWTKSSANPLLSADKDWEGVGVSFATVTRESDSLFTMYYSNLQSSANTGFGIADSKDGIHWNKRVNNPCFTSNDASVNWGADVILYPCYIKTDKEHRIYYSGYSGGIFRIGYAKKAF